MNGAQYDIVVLGSGIGGSTLALALAKIGCKVLVIEKKSHPRFAIGESTVPATTIGWELLSKKYDIPEFEQISQYLNIKEIGLTAYPKSHFWFGLHREMEQLEERHELMFETLPMPLGPDVHLLRSEVDAWLVSRFPRYGIDYMDNTNFEDLEYNRSSKKVTVTINDGSPLKVTANLVLDASGHAAILARKFGLMADPDELNTNTRALYGHFTGVNYMDILKGANPRFRINRDGGTMHHCFEGGWIWVIRFDNGTTSIGIMLDNNILPPDPKLSPEEEWQKVINRFPSIKQHFENAQAITPITRSGRVQFHTTVIAGDGFVFTPHASAFVEPPFSTGILLTQTFIARFIPIIKNALYTGDYSKEQFAPMEKTFLHEVRMVDKIVDGTIRSFHNFEVFKQYLRLWIYSNAFQFLSQVFSPLGNLDGMNQIFGTASSTWCQLIDDMYEVVSKDQLGDEEKVQQLSTLIEQIPNPYDVSDFKPGTGHSSLITLTMIRPDSYRFFEKIMLDNAEMKNQLDLNNFIAFTARLNIRLMEVRAKYALSKLLNGDYAKKIDGMYEMVSSTSYKGRKDFFAPFNGPWNARFLKKQPS